MSLLARWAGLKCPGCGSRVPYLAASLTFRWLPWQLANAWMACAGCGERLKMRLHVPAWCAVALWAAQVGIVGAVCAGLGLAALNWASLATPGQMIAALALWLVMFSLAAVATGAVRMRWQYRMVKA